MNKKAWFGLGLGIGLLKGWAVAQQAWAVYKLSRIDPQRELAAGIDGVMTSTTPQVEERETYTITRVVDNGIERITYTPKNRRFATPLFMQHGMWHGAWCWESWQELFAEWGWESCAISLPGHAGSPEQRPIELCTLDYYLGFVKREIERLPHPPVYIGHSMGGALGQWYLKYVGDDLPAAVMIAPWTSHSVMWDGALSIISNDPRVIPLSMWQWNAASWVATPSRAAKMLISDHAVCSPEELHGRLGPESIIATYQHNPPFWRPPESVKTPLLWLAAGADTLLPEPAERRSAAYYGADYVVVDDAGHNIMMEKSHRETAVLIHNWLAEHVA